MEDFFPTHLSQYIRPVKLAADKSKGQVVCSCGCEEFDYNYLFFKYVPSEENKKMEEIENRAREMREQRIGPYKDIIQGSHEFWTSENCNGKHYDVMYLYIMYEQDRTHTTLEEIVNDPNYIGHFEAVPYDPNKPSEYQYICAKCKHCGKEILLFDERYYGYDGVCTHLERPNKPYLTNGKLKTKKSHCEGAGYKIFITISSTGKEDLFENASGVITDENWKDAFDWIEINIECAKCGKKKKTLSLETM